MFKKVEALLNKIKENKENPDYIEYEKIKKRWASKVDKKLQKNAKIIDFTDGKITLKISKTTWKNEVLFMKEELKKNFQVKKTQYKR